MTTREIDSPQVSVAAYIAICGIPTICLLYLATAPLSKWPLRWKQILSIPLMAASTLGPVSVNTRYLVVDLITGSVIGGLFHRFLDVFWLRPIVHKQPAWVPWEQFNRDFWSAQYNFKQAKIDSEEGDSVKSTRTLRSSFYLVPTILASFIVTDILGALLTTYSREDVFYAQQHNLWRYLIIFVVGLSAVNSEFIYAGNFNQFLSTLFTGGTYVEEHWKPLMDKPFKATSLELLWSQRWHQSFRQFWLSVPYHPVRTYSSKYFGKYFPDSVVKPLSMALSTLSVFFMSGCLHEYMNVILLGRSTYSKFAGYELKFFLSHGVAIVLEKLITKSISPYIPDRRPYTWMKAVLGWVWVMTFTFYTFPWFFSSFTEAEIWHMLTMGLTKERFTKFATETKWMRALCGSLL